MQFPFLSRLSLRKVTVGTANEAGQQARIVLNQLLNDLPDLLMTCVVEVPSGRVLASYTTAASLNPNQISLRYAKLLRATEMALAAQHIPGGPLTEMALLLDEHLHLVRPVQGGQSYCFLAVRSADTNLAMACELLRRHTTLLS